MPGYLLIYIHLLALFEGAALELQTDMFIVIIIIKVSAVLYVAAFMGRIDLLDYPNPIVFFK